MSDEDKNDSKALDDEQAEETENDAAWEAVSDDHDKAESAGFAPVSDTSAPVGAESEINLDVILDVPVTVSMEVGNTKISIRNLLQLNQGSVIELDRLAGEPMDVLVNKTLIARGEVVVVNDKFGLRLTDIISPAERVKKLK
ncbi:MAG: flagellar motor switch protein FliN [Cycloclasticus sp.]